ncbi:MAG: DUF3298 domain-containing protein [Ginsengibacter sp.]
MKRITLAIIAGFILLASCQQKKNNQVSDPEIKKDSIVPTSFYKRFEGTIAGQPVIMHLHKNENKLEAGYYYKSTGGWLTLSADSFFGDSIVFREYAAVYNFNNDIDDDTLRPQLRCRLQNDTLAGIWISKDKKNSYPIVLKESYPEGSYKFSFESYADSVKAYPTKAGSPMAEMDNSFVVCENNEWLNDELKKILNYDSSLSFKNGFTKAVNVFFADYKKELPAKMDSTDLQMLNYSNSNNLYVRYNEKDFVIIESEVYSYSGGVHGNYGSNFYCFDLNGKKRMELYDIVSADSITMQHVAEKYFRMQYNVKTALNEVLFENNLAANDNFYFNEKGIGFLYNPYEVASYAQGEINVFIPFTALEKFILPGFKSRMHLHF